MNRENIQATIINLLVELTDVQPDVVHAETPLIGQGAVINSRSLVELLLSLEEFAEEKLGANFNWTSDSAMSSTRSIMRTVGSLTDALFALQKA